MRSGHPFQEFRQQAVTWEENVSLPSVSEVVSDEQASSEGMKYGDICTFPKNNRNKVGLKIASCVNNKDTVCSYCKKKGHIKANTFKLQNRRNHLNSSNRDFMHGTNGDKHF